jgi:hypothetical protein
MAGALEMQPITAHDVHGSAAASIGRAKDTVAFDLAHDPF